MGLWLRSFGHLVGALRMTIRRSFLQRAEKQRLPATVRGHERPQVQKADPSYVRASLN